jgi:hypothetical protein
MTSANIRDGHRRQVWLPCGCEQRSVRGNDNEPHQQIRCRICKRVTHVELRPHHYAGYWRAHLALAQEVPA